MEHAALHEALAAALAGLQKKARCRLGRDERQSSACTAASAVALPGSVGVHERRLTAGWHGGQGPMDPEEEWRAREKERRKRRRTCCFVPLPTFMQPERAKRQPTIRRPEEVHPGARLQQARAQSSRTSARAAGKSPAGTPSLSSGSGSDRRKRKRHAPRRAASHAKARAGADGPTHASNGSSDAESGQRTDDSDDDVEAARAESHRQVDGAGDEHDTEKGATGKLDLEDPHKDMDIVYRKVRP